jgi:hypothetical protein
MFARFKIRGKQLRRSLETTNLDLVERKLVELERNERAIEDDRGRGKMLFGEALDEYLQTRERDVTLKPRTRAYDEQQVVALPKTWPGLREVDIRRISREVCERRASVFAGKHAPSAFNHTPAILKHTLGRAIERGVRYDNPAKKLER